MKPFGLNKGKGLYFASSQSSGENVRMCTQCLLVGACVLIKLKPKIQLLNISSTTSFSFSKKLAIFKHNFQFIMSIKHKYECLLFIGQIKPLFNQG